MDVDHKDYNEYLRNHKRKQNKGAMGRVDSEKGKTYQAEWAFQKRVNIKKFKDLKEG